MAHNSAPAGTRRAQLADIALHDESVHARLLTEEGVVACALPVPSERRHAVRHAVALHGHSPCCPRESSRLVTVLSQAATLAGGYRPWLVVAAGPPARAWLQVKSPFGEVSLPIETVDSVCLLTSCQVPVGVADDDTEASNSDRDSGRA